MRARLVFWGLLALALLAGAGLRLWRVQGQILGDDEMHAVRAAMQHPVSNILVTYQDNDNCIPLSALFRARLDRGEHLDEMDFRAVPLALGILVLLVPLLWRGWIPDRMLLLWSWLLALSPLLISYSRIVRSYMPLVTLGLLAAAAAWRALHATGPGRRIAWWSLYVVAAALAAWFHLGAIPFVGAPWLFLLWQVIRRQRGRWPELAALGVALAGAMLAFLVPARASLLTLMQGKAGTELPTLAGISETLILQSGSRFVVGGFGFWLLVLWGLRHFLRAHPRLAAFTVTLVLTQLVGLLAFAPAGVRHPIILNRYLLVMSPVALAWAGYGVHRLAGKLVWPGAGLLTGGAALATLLVLGPYTDAAFRTSSFQHHYRLARFSHPRPLPPEEQVPAFYYDLRREPGGRPVYEYPWSYGWPVNHAIPAYQEIHGRRVLVVYRDGTYYHPGVDWRNLMHFSNDRFLQTDARYLIVHKDLRNEELRVRPEGFQPTRNMVRQWNRHRSGGRIVSAMLRSDWGTPWFEDEDIIVWDLDRVRETHPGWKTLMGVAHEAQ